MMKIHTNLLLGITALIIGSPAFAQKPILDFNFNESRGYYENEGTAKVEAKRSGKNHKTGEAGSGVSGKKSDRAWDATRNTVAGAEKDDDGKYNNSLVQITDRIKEMDEIKAFTAVIWYTSEQQPDSAVRYFGKANSSTTTKMVRGFIVRSYAPKSMGGKSAIELMIGDGSAPQQFVSDYFPKGKGYNIWGPENEWVFMAITWDGSIIKFYSGNTKEPVTPAGARRYSGKLEAETKAPLVLANTTAKNRGLDGKIDNFRFYDRALSMDQLEELRQKDVKGDD